jgi:predicted transcriptional regulator
LKQNRNKSSGHQITPLSRLSNTEKTVMNAISSQSKLEDKNLVDKIVETTKLSELQVRAAFFLLLQKKLISSREIIDMET